MASNLKLVCWSGGCDSTLVLYNALREQKVWTVKGEQRGEVRSIAFNCSSVCGDKRMRMARDRIRREFKRRGLVLRHTEVIIGPHAGASGPGLEQFGQRHERGGSVQAQMWIGLATPYLCKTEDLVLGWIDGEFDNVADVRAAFDALQRIGNKSGSLSFPIENETKYSVIDHLRSHRLLDLCWYCEGHEPAYARRAKIKTPDVLRAGKPCGNCKSCLVHETALWQLKHFSRYALYGEALKERS